MVTHPAPPTDLDLCLLGPLRVSIEDRELSLGGPRQMAVLARLMVTPGQVVSMEQLIDSVWDGGEPARPAVTIRSYVSNLRRAIEPNRRRRAADSCLASSPPGYRLAVEPTAVDWVRFQRLIDEARARSLEGDDVAAVTVLRRALSLWRGEPCAGLPTSEVFETHRLRLTSLRQTAVEVLYESLLNQGRHDAVATEIEPAIVADPLRERLTELGMLAFYRAGRQSEALALGRRLRDRLRDSLGIDPSPAIEDIELRILNHDRSLDREPTGVVRRTDRPAAVAPPVPVAEASPSPVPVGRQGPRQRLASVDAALAAGRVGAAALVGEPGIGKTTLARELADRLAGTGTTIAWATAVPEVATPWWPWSQVVLELLERDGRATDELTAGLDGLAGLGRSVSAAIGNHPSASMAAADTILAVSALLGRCARRNPLLVVLDDLHEADRASITLVEYLVSTLGDVPIGIVALWRGPLSEQGPVPAALRSLARLPDLARIDLGPLDATEIGELGASIGRPVEPSVATRVRRRSAGNPRLARELLDVADDNPSTEGARSSITPSLQALVSDLVGGIHPLATTTLRAAALFRSPFAAEDLAPLHRTGSGAVERVMAAALRAQVLTEDDPSLGTCRFRHPIVQEVLAADSEPSELRASHRIIGTHLLATDEAEASYHLAWSPEPADRALAARIALDLFHRQARTVPLAELDGRIRHGLTAAESLRRHGLGAGFDDLVTDALGFLSWRARVDDRPVDWADNAGRHLRAALEELEGLARPDEEETDRSAPRASTPLRGAARDPARHRPIDRLERSVFDIVGLPAVPAGPGDPNDYTITEGPVLAEMAGALERLPPSSPAVAAARIHLLAAATAGLPADADRSAAVHEAEGLLASIRSRGDAGLAPAIASMIARFDLHLDPETLVALLDEHAELAPGPGADLLWARYGYPALLATSRLDAAVGRLDDALSSAEVAGDPLLRSEARFLLARHLLWRGELDDAGRAIEESSAELSALGLPDPLPIQRQRRAHRGLGGKPGDDLPGSSVFGLGRVPLGLLTRDRVSPAEKIFRLAHFGQRDRAAEYMTRQTTTEALARCELAEVALLGFAAALVRHRDTAAQVQDRLEALGDRLVLRCDGSVIYGPASLWAAVAARGAGRHRSARRLLDAGIEQIRAYGGTVPIELVAPILADDELPIELQPNLKPAGAG